MDRFAAGTIDAERVYDLENQLPRNRTILGVNYQTPWQFDMLLRVNYYDGWEDRTFGETSTFGEAWIVDLAGTVHLPGGYRVSAGAENLFDEYPDEEQNSILRFLGAVRPLSSPFGINGGLWFLRITAEFQ